ncbi:MAG TPA: cytochrome c oxidase subunit 3 [Acidimicrobiales bacterium]|jgi:cytochrome c oxidase subunit 3/cytochrome o ubiquinol oxidase subunit 3
MTETAVPAVDIEEDPAQHPKGVPSHATSTGISNEKLAMWVFLGSDCLLFGGLISTYLLLRHRSTHGPGPKLIFDVPFTSVSSFVLLFSSLTMALAVAAIHRGDERRCRVFLVTTALLGGTFIAGQVYEFTTFVKEGLGYTTNIFGSAFYTLTGFHGVHVSVGIVFLLSMFVMSIRGKLGPEKAETVEIFGLYWHFVDIVWILIFTIVYLIP